VAVVHVTGHRNPDLDSIGSAIGYAELKQRIEPEHTWVPARLGPVNAQTAWALERAGLEAPELLPHIHLRTCDVMRELPLITPADAPVREVGLAMAERRVELVAVTDRDGTLAGVITDRELARMYIRESRGASTFEERPVTLRALAAALDGQIESGDEDRELTGRLWVGATDVEALEHLIRPGDIMVVGNRPDVQRKALERGAAALVTSHGTHVDADVRALAEERGAALLVSPLDSYVTARMAQLAIPCSAVMDRKPMTTTPEDFASTVGEDLKSSGVRAAVVVDADRRPIGMVRRADLVTPDPRRVLLVDHAEQRQSVPGIEHAAVIEILDHHHIGSIQTTLPIKATFDPVGSTATLVVERFRREGREPKRPTAIMLLGALLSDTVILTSPTTTERDRHVAEYLEELLGEDPREFGSEMFRAASDLTDVPAEEIVERDAKAYTGASGRAFYVAQVEVVGDELLSRRSELLAALAAAREQREAALVALMVTDITAKQTELLLAGDTAAVERAFDRPVPDGAVTLPGVMSRKKQVAPPLLAAV
jgi:manganese-dependent inorganic pyrophosphatase